jgi:glycine cleavage system transcriptional repressor
MKYLALTILAEANTNVVAEFYQLVEHCECVVVESRCNWLGNELCLYALLSGAWNAIAKMESGITVLESMFDLKLAMRRTDQRKFMEETELYPYSVYVTAPANPLVVNRIVGFFTAQTISLNEVVIDSYLAPYTQAKMLMMTLSINIPSSLSISDLRDRFMLFCDDYNFDAMMGPEKD